ncbi:MAG: hypothetical protein U0610_33505 [bacterium]
MPVVETAVVAAAPPATAAELAEVLQRVERAVLRRFRTLEPTSLAEIASALRFVVPKLEALKSAASKRAAVFHAEDYRKINAERQAENAAIREADEAWRHEYLAEQREKRLVALGRKPKR